MALVSLKFMDLDVCLLKKNLNKAKAKRNQQNEKTEEAFTLMLLDNIAAVFILSCQYDTHILQWLPLESLQMQFYEVKLPFSERFITT